MGGGIWDLGFARQYIIAVGPPHAWMLGEGPPSCTRGLPAPCKASMRGVVRELLECSALRGALRVAPRAPSCCVVQACRDPPTSSSTLYPPVLAPAGTF